MIGCTHLLRVQHVPPRVRHVVRIPNDIPHENLRVKDSVLLGHHATCHSEDGTADTKVEQNRPMGRDLEVEKQVRISDGRKKEDCGEGASNKSHESTRAFNQHSNRQGPSQKRTA